MALGLPQASPNEEDLDTIAEEPLAETTAAQSQLSYAQPPETSFEASPNEEDLDTIAEEPLAETRAAQTQSSYAQPPETGFDTSEQQQTLELEAATRVPSRDDGAGSHARGQGGCQDAGSAERTDAEGPSQASQGDSRVPPKQSNRSLTGSCFSVFFRAIT